MLTHSQNYKVHFKYLSWIHYAYHFTLAVFFPQKISKPQSQYGALIWLLLLLQREHNVGPLLFVWFRGQTRKISGE